MTDREKFIDILLEFYEEYQNNIPNRPMIPSIYASKIIDSLQQEETINGSLEDAASYFARKDSKEINNPANFFYVVAEKARIFKAGAEWQKEQMMANAINAEASLTMSVPSICISLPLNVNVGDKVKVIVIKEDLT